MPSKKEFKKNVRNLERELREDGDVIELDDLNENAPESRLNNILDSLSEKEETATRLSDEINYSQEGAEQYVKNNFKIPQLEKLFSKYDNLLKDENFVDLAKSKYKETANLVVVNISNEDLVRYSNILLKRMSLFLLPHQLRYLAENQPNKFHLIVDHLATSGEEESALKVIQSVPNDVVERLGVYELEVMAKYLSIGQLDHIVSQGNADQLSQAIKNLAASKPEYLDTLLDRFIADAVEGNEDKKDKVLRGVVKSVDVATILALDAGIIKKMLPYAEESQVKEILSQGNRVKFIKQLSLERGVGLQDIDDNEAYILQELTSYYMADMEGGALKALVPALNADDLGAIVNKIKNPSTLSAIVPSLNIKQLGDPALNKVALKRMAPHISDAQFNNDNIGKNFIFLLNHSNRDSNMMRGIDEEVLKTALQSDKVTKRKFDHVALDQVVKSQVQFALYNKYKINKTKSISQDEADEYLRMAAINGSADAQMEMIDRSMIKDIDVKRQYQSNIKRHINKQSNPVVEEEFKDGEVSADQAVGHRAQEDQVPVSRNAGLEDLKKRFYQDHNSGALVDAIVGKVGLNKNRIFTKRDKGSSVLKGALKNEGIKKGGRDFIRSSQKDPESGFPGFAVIDGKVQKGATVKNLGVEDGYERRKYTVVLDENNKCEPIKVQVPGGYVELNYENGQFKKGRICNDEGNVVEDEKISSEMSNAFKNVKLAVAAVTVVEEKITVVNIGYVEQGESHNATMHTRKVKSFWNSNKKDKKTVHHKPKSKIDESGLELPNAGDDLEHRVKIHVPARGDVEDEVDYVMDNVVREEEGGLLKQAVEKLDFPQPAKKQEDLGDFFQSQDAKEVQEVNRHDKLKEFVDRSFGSFSKKEALYQSGFVQRLKSSTDSKIEYAKNEVAAGEELISIKNPTVGLLQGGSTPDEVVSSVVDSIFAMDHLGINIDDLELKRQAVAEAVKVLKESEKVSVEDKAQEIIDSVTQSVISLISQQNINPLKEVIDTIHDQVSKAGFGDFEEELALSDILKTLDEATARSDKEDVASQMQESLDRIFVVAAAVDVSIKETGVTESLRDDLVKEAYLVTKESNVAVLTALKNAIVTIESDEEDIAEFDGFTVAKESSEKTKQNIYLSKLLLRQKILEDATKAVLEGLGKEVYEDGDSEEEIDELSSQVLDAMEDEKGNIDDALLKKLVNIAKRKYAEREAESSLSEVDFGVLDSVAKESFIKRMVEVSGNIAQGNDDKDELVSQRESAVSQLKLTLSKQTAKIVVVGTVMEYAKRQELQNAQKDLEREKKGKEFIKQKMQELKAQEEALSSKIALAKERGEYKKGLDDKELVEVTAKYAKLEKEFFKKSHDVSRAQLALSPLKVAESSRNELRNLSLDMATREEIKEVLNAPEKVVDLVQGYLGSAGDSSAESSAASQDVDLRSQERQNLAMKDIMRQELKLHKLTTPEGREFKAKVDAEKSALEKKNKEEDEARKIELSIKKIKDLTANSSTTGQRIMSESGSDAILEIEELLKLANASKTKFTKGEGAYKGNRELYGEGRYLAALCKKYKWITSDKLSEAFPDAPNMSAFIRIDRPNVKYELGDSCEKGTDGMHEVVKRKARSSKSKEGQVTDLNAIYNPKKGIGEHAAKILKYYEDAAIAGDPLATAKLMDLQADRDKDPKKKTVANDYWDNIKPSDRRFISDNYESLSKYGAIGVNPEDSYDSERRAQDKGSSALKKLYSVGSKGARNAMRRDAEAGPSDDGRQDEIQREEDRVRRNQELVSKAREEQLKDLEEQLRRAQVKVEKLQEFTKSNSEAEKGIAANKEELEQRLVSLNEELVKITQEKQEADKDVFKIGYLPARRDEEEEEALSRKREQKEKAKQKSRKLKQQIQQQQLELQQLYQESSVLKAKLLVATEEHDNNKNELSSQKAIVKMLSEQLSILKLLQQSEVSRSRSGSVSSVLDGGSEDMRTRGEDLLTYKSSDMDKLSEEDVNRRRKVVTRALYGDSKFAASQYRKNTGREGLKKLESQYVELLNQSEQGYGGNMGEESFTKAQQGRKKEVQLFDSSSYQGDPNKEKEGKSNFYKFLRNNGITFHVEYSEENVKMFNRVFMDNSLKVEARKQNPKECFVPIFPGGDVQKPKARHFASGREEIARSNTSSHVDRLAEIRLGRTLQEGLEGGKIIRR